MGLAFLFSMLKFSKKLSSIFGYIFSIFMIMLSVNINYTIFIRPLKIPWYLNMIPQITFTRIILIFSVECYYDRCVTSIDKLDRETIELFGYLFLVPLIYILVVYFVEIYKLKNNCSKKFN